MALTWSMTLKWNLWYHRRDPVEVEPAERSSSSTCPHRRAVKIYYRNLSKLQINLERRVDTSVTSHVKLAPLFSMSIGRFTAVGWTWADVISIKLRFSYHVLANFNDVKLKAPRNWSVRLFVELSSNPPERGARSQWELGGDDVIELYGEDTVLNTRSKQYKY